MIFIITKANRYLCFKMNSFVKPYRSSKSKINHNFLTDLINKKKSKTPYIIMFQFFVYRTASLMLPIYRVHRKPL